MSAYNIGTSTHWSSKERVNGNKPAKGYGNRDPTSYNASDHAGVNIRCVLNAKKKNNPHVDMLKITAENCQKVLSSLVHRSRTY